MRKVGGSKKSCIENGRDGNSIPYSIPKMVMNGRVRRLELKAWELWCVNWVEPKASSLNGWMYVHSSTEKSLHQSIPTARVEDFGCNSVQDVLHYTYILHLLIKCLSDHQVLYMPCTLQCWVLTYTAECRVSPRLAQLSSEGSTGLMAGTFFLLLQQVLQCSEFCAVPGSETVQRFRNYWVMLQSTMQREPHLFLGDVLSPLLWDTSSGTSLDQLCTLVPPSSSVSKEEQKHIRKVVWTW